MLDFCVLYSVFNVHFNSILNTRQSEAIVVLSQPSFRTVSPYSCFLFFFSHDMIAYVMLFGICVSVEQLSFTDITYEGKGFYEKDTA